jgi:crossover junction endodeoxyribonuclease RusA
MRAAKIDANQPEIVLPWPPKELSPNARVHWAKKSRITKGYRVACMALCRNAGLVEAPEGPLRLVLEFIPPDRRRRDDDNLLSSTKALRDGIADALGIDDSRFTTQFSVRDEPAKGGAVRVRVEAV